MNNVDKKIRSILKEATFGISNLSDPYDDKIYVDAGPGVNKLTDLGVAKLGVTQVTDIPAVINRLPKVFADGDCGSLAKDLWFKMSPASRPKDDKLKQVPFPSRQEEFDKPIPIERWLQPFVQISAGGASAVTGKGEVAAYLYFKNVQHSSNKSYDLMTSAGEFISVKYSDEYAENYPRLGSGREEVNTAKKRMQDIWTKEAGNTPVIVNVKKETKIFEGEGGKGALEQAIESNLTISSESIVNSLKAGGKQGSIETIFRKFSEEVMNALFAAEIADTSKGKGKKGAAPANEENATATKAKYLLNVSRNAFVVHKVVKDQPSANPPVRFLEITSGRTRFAPVDVSDPTKKITYAPQTTTATTQTSAAPTTRQVKQANKDAFRAQYGMRPIQSLLDSTNPAELKDFMQKLSKATTGIDDYYTEKSDVLDLAKKLKLDLTDLASNLIASKKRDENEELHEKLIRDFVKKMLL